MEIKEIYVAWKPNDFTHHGVDFVSLTDERGELKILLEYLPLNKNNQMLEIRFECPDAYCNIDEGYRLELLPFEPEERSIIYTVENSIFLKEFHRQSHDIYNNFGILHYFISTANDCIDVLSKVEPKVDWLRSN